MELKKDFLSSKAPLIPSLPFAYICLIKYEFIKYLNLLLTFGFN